MSQTKVKGKGFLQISKLIAEQVVVVMALHKGYLRLTNLLHLAFYFKTEPKGEHKKMINSVCIMLVFIYIKIFNKV